MDDWDVLREECWALNTRTAYKSRWNRYYGFCTDYGLVPLPASVTNMCLYITFLSKSVGYVTIKNYVSSVWVLHDHMGVPHVDPDNFLIKSTLQGAKRVLGSATRQVDPLSPGDLMCIHSSLDMNSWGDFVMWCAIVLCFRCLLRVSHVTSSPHTLRVKDVVFWGGGWMFFFKALKLSSFVRGSIRSQYWQHRGRPYAR